MADYTQPDVVNKRVRFFDGQFLQDQDFIDEQKYHLDRERRQSRLLNITGIVSGLMVIKGGAYQVTVAKGVAVDTQGRQLVLATETNLRLPDTFANKQGIALHLVYRESPSDLAQTGGEGARRWDESPKIVALAPDGTAAVVPDGASSTWDGPTVLLAQLAVATNGDVTVDTTVARKAGLSVSGAVGIGTTTPGSDLEIGNFDARDRYLTLKVQGGNQYRSGVKLWAWQQNYGYSIEYDERGATGNGLHVRTHDRNADGVTRLFVGWNGNVGVGTAGPPWKLSVSSSKDHLALYREPAETVGGKQVFLELAQIDSAPAKVPVVFPSIRFHHHNRFWHRIEARGPEGEVAGLHFKTGDPNRDDYSPIRAGEIHANGDVFVHGRLVYYWGPDKQWKHIQNKANDFAGSYTTNGPSDGRLKTAIRPIRNALDKISGLTGVDFRWNSAGIEYLTGNVEASLSAGPGATDEENRRLWVQERRKAAEELSGEYLGLIAQDVEKVVPQVVREGSDGYKHINYAHLTALLIEAVKEQQKNIERLRARIAAVEPTPA